MFRRRTDAGVDALDVYDDRRLRTSHAEEKADSKPDPSAPEVTLDASASARTSTNNAFEEHVAKEFAEMQRDVERHFGELSTGLFERGGSILGALFGAAPGPHGSPVSELGEPGVVTSSFAYSSSSRTVDKEGNVQEKIVTTQTGPDGMSTTKSVVRTPDGGETVSVVRESAPEAVMDFGGEFASFLGPIFSAAMGMSPAFSGERQRVFSTEQQTPSSGAPSGFPLISEPGALEDRKPRETPEHRPSEKTWRFGNALRQAWKAFQEG